MKPEMSLLEKAERSIRSGKLLANDGDLDAAASRLYYAMFYITEALLTSFGKTYSSHQALISAYGREFAKTKILDPKHHRALKSAFDNRALGDYKVDSGLSLVDIQKMEADAQAFLAEARQWLATHSASNADEGQL